MLLAVSSKELTMQDTRTVHRSFVRRLDAERRWNQLYRLLLELGQPLLVMPDDDPAGAPLTHTEVHSECGCLCASFNPTASSGANHRTTGRALAGESAGR